MKPDTYDKPSEVVAEKGRVLIDGPDGVDVALTPDAALETSVRLRDKARSAREQAEVASQEQSDGRDTNNSPEDNAEAS